MKPTFVVITVLILAGLVGAEDKPLTKVVRVTGTAEVQVVPDRAVIDIGVEKQNSSAIAAKHAADEASRQILASLRKNHID